VMTIPEEIRDLFDKAGFTLAVAESASAGHLAAVIASVSGVSSFFRGGVVAYHIDAKVNILGVNRDEAARCNCVSPQVAQEMAAGVRRLFGTNVGIAITGYAEPTDDVEDPYAWICIDINGFARVMRVMAPEDGPNGRLDAQEEYAWTAMETLVDYLDDPA